MSETMTQGRANLPDAALPVSLAVDQDLATAFPRSGRRATGKAVQELNSAAGMFSLSVLADNAHEYYCGLFENKAVALRTAGCVRHVARRGEL